MSRTTVLSLDAFIQMPGERDEYDRDDPASGVFGKAQMKAFMKTAIDNMTPKQRSVYLRVIVEGKSAAEIANEDNCHISNVYKHLSKANRKIVELKNLSQSVSGKSDLAALFFSIFNEIPLLKKSLTYDYYIEGLTLAEIAEKRGVNIGYIETLLHEAKQMFYRNSLTKNDLRYIRKYFKEGKKSGLKD